MIANDTSLNCLGRGNNGNKNRYIGFVSTQEKLSGLNKLVYYPIIPVQRTTSDEKK